MLSPLDWVAQTLNSQRADTTLAVLAQLSLGQQPTDSDVGPLLAEFEQAGLGTLSPRGGFRLNLVGQKCGDAAREYRFWCQRDRRLHGEGRHPALVLDEFRGCHVLEIGPGWGCNLFRLASVTSEIRGLELEPVYVQFAQIFARLEGVSPPAIDLGRAEALPYADRAFDRVICFSSLEYTDIDRALAEIVRVLREGGRLVATIPTFSQARAHLMEALPRRDPTVYALTTLVNSLAYGVVGKRVRGPVEGRGTARPVYLTQRQLFARLRLAGLQPRPDLSTYEEHTLTVVADKPRSDS